MILNLYDLQHNKIAGLKKYKDANIESELSMGDKTLSFLWHNSNGQEIPLEGYIRTDTDEYVVKENSKGSNGYRKIVARLNLEEVEGFAWEVFSGENLTAQEMANDALASTGWRCVSTVAGSKKRNISLKKVSAYAIIEKIVKIFTCEVYWDTINKIVYLKERVGSDKGAYFIKGLNLKELSDSSDSYDFATRLVPIGADDLGITDINNGKNYVENYQYSSKIKTVIWEDSSYTDAQALKEDAEYKLNEISKPKRTYQAKIYDLAKMKPEYSILEYSIGDTVLLVDNETNIREKQRITKTVEYIDNPQKNTCDISNTVLSFADMQKQLQETVDCVENITKDNGTIKITAIEGVGISDAKTVNGHTVDANVPSDAKFTDENVKQYNLSPVNDGDYPLLVASTGKSGSTTGPINYTKNATYNPSKNTISANISGNAAAAKSADKADYAEAVRQYDITGSDEDAEIPLLLSSGEPGGDIRQPTQYSRNLTYNPSTYTINADISGIAIYARQGFRLEETDSRDAHPILFSQPPTVDGNGMGSYGAESEFMYSPEATYTPGTNTLDVNISGNAATANKASEAENAATAGHAVTAGCASRISRLEETESGGGHPILFGQPPTENADGTATYNGETDVMYSPSATYRPNTNTLDVNISGRADSADSAVKDGDGNIITDTYVTKEEAEFAYLYKLMDEATFYGGDTVMAGCEADGNCFYRIVLECTTTGEIIEDIIFDGNDEIVGKYYTISITYAYGELTVRASVNDAPNYSFKLSLYEPEIGNKANKDGSNASGTWGISIGGNAATADTATKAVEDGDGNVIKDTYATKEAVFGRLLFESGLGDTDVGHMEVIDYSKKPLYHIILTDSSKEVVYEDVLFDIENSTPIYIDTDEYSLHIERQEDEVSLYASRNSGTEVYWVFMYEGGLSAQVGVKANADGSNASGKWDIDILGNAATADTATKATKDGDGNIIADTYATKEELEAVEVGGTTDLANYAKKDGSNVSGIWGIDISGNAKTVNGHSVSADVPSGAKFTDTTYNPATQSAQGLMSAADKKKLDGIATGANAYSHPTYTSKSSGLYKVTVNGTGHVSATTAVAKSDITALGIPAQDTTYSNFVKSGSGAKAGLVPAPSTTAGTTKYLREDGTWAVPPDNNTVYTHPNSGVTAGTYRSVTVNAAGHVTAGSNPTTTVAQGGTGATDASTARSNLGITPANIGAAMKMPSSNSDYAFPGHSSTGSHNIDELYNAGVYGISGGSNCPSGGQYGEVIVLPWNNNISGNTNAGYGAQIFLPNGDDSSKPDSLFFRTAKSGTWRSWQEVAKVNSPSFTGSISLGRKSGTANGSNSVAMGYNVTASETYSHAEGDATIAMAYGSHAEGYGTEASGAYAHAEGRDTTAGAYGSHAEGYTSTASGSYSHAEGCSTNANGYGSHAEGYGTTALNYQHSQGHYNNTTTATAGGNSGTGTGTAFVIGNGTSSSKSNAMRVTYNGQIYAPNASIATGADYAEYFEWADQNPNNEDRVGLFVTFDEDNPEMIRIANDGDYILGIVSGMPSVIGNGDECWKQRYILDEFGRYIEETFEYEEVKITMETIEVEEVVEVPTIDEDGNEQITTETRIVTKKVPKENKVIKTGTKWKENPDYDSEQPYTQRSERPEWSAVGMVGVLSVYDDGTCKVNGYCKCSKDGIATASETGYRVIKRVTDNIVKVVLK